jgi:hypothetical protein
MDKTEPKSHEMGVQVQSYVYTQGQETAAVCGVTPTPGRDEQVIRNCIRHQEKEDARLEQLGLWR